MAKVNAKGYVARKTCGGTGKRLKSIYRDWFLIKHGTNAGIIPIGLISFPNHMIGKKVRLKVEVIEEGENYGTE